MHIGQNRAQNAQPNTQKGHLNFHSDALTVVKNSFSMPEQIRIKEFRQINFQPVTDLLNGRNRSRLGTAAQDIAQCRPGDSTYVAKSAHSQAALLA